ncbi:hypothetical protein [Pseudanabaena sp. 'Roaring Creek']|uniref:hypothetical protein n=1 Tax=Pseudanabaena sp. 'Roaring Creek' TaxID=1681830 RepID=UPI0006D83BC5|nr:hypothetical protein [Pseudanabaena sp. 'Roaring Creek']
MNFQAYTYSLSTKTVKWFGQFRTLHEAECQTKPMEASGNAIAIIHKDEIILSSAFKRDITTRKRTYFRELPKWVARIKSFAAAIA